jgi:hypothetical protein
MNDSEVELLPRFAGNQSAATTANQLCRDGKKSQVQ